MVQCIYIHKLFLETFEYKLISNNNIKIAIIGMPCIDINLTFMDDQKLGGKDVSFINVLFMLKTDTCFISGILLAKFCKLY